MWVDVRYRGLGLCHSIARLAPGSSCPAPGDSCPSRREGVALNATSEAPGLESWAFPAPGPYHALNVGT